MNGEIATRLVVSHPEGISGGAILNSYGTNRFNGNVPELAIGGTPITEQ